MDLADKEQHEPITIIYRVRIKDEHVETFQQLVVNTLTPEAHGISGCQQFSVYQNTDDKREFIFHELWDNKDSVHTYKQNLIATLGEPHEGEEFPAAMNDLIESDEDLM